VQFPPGIHNIVLVEDDESVRDALQFRLQTAGFAVRAYAGVDEALRAGMSEPACLVVDQRLGACDGLDLICRMKDLHGVMPAILITSYPGPVLRSRAAAAGVAIVEKPLIGDRLLVRLRELGAVESKLPPT
jgi:two-component system, LuxR family, response regulator FixJ